MKFGHHTTDSNLSPIGSVIFAYTLKFLLAALLGIAGISEAQVNLDSDSDNLLDSWEIMHFGSLSNPDGDPTDDPDGDGRDNQFECDASTNPLDPNCCLLTTVSSEFDPNGFEIRWPTVPGKKYHIEVSTDLSTWTRRC